MILTIILTIALDTLPVKPIPVLLPKPVKSEKIKINDKAKNNQTNDADRRVLGVRPDRLAAR